MSTQKSQGIEQQVEEERLYNSVLAYVETEHGIDSDHYREMRNYAPKAIRDDREKGKSLHPAENMKVA